MKNCADLNPRRIFEVCIDSSIEIFVWIHHGAIVRQARLPGTSPFEPGAIPSMKPPPRALKRKRTLDQDEQPPRKIVKSRKVEQEQSAVVTFGNGPIAPRDTTSETSALTSADEIATATTATGVDSDECKYTAQNGRLSGP